MSKKKQVEQPPPMPTLAHVLREAGMASPPPQAWEIEMGQNAWRHQTDLLNRLLRFDRYGVYDEPGCGKTLPTMAAVIYNGLIGNKLAVVMPPALLFQIQNTLRAVFRGADRHISWVCLNKGPAQRDKLIGEWKANPAATPEIVLMSYQIFKKEWNRLDGLLVGLVCDEAQALCNPQTANYRSAKQFLGRPGEKLFWPMTGTPIPNELIDAYGLISLVTPDAYASFDQFDRMHCTYKNVRPKSGGRGFPVRTGYLWTERIQQALFASARRVLRSHVLDVDDPQFVPMAVELHKKHRDLYRRIIRQRWVQKGEVRIEANNQQRLRQMVLQCVANPHMYSETKVESALEEWLFQLFDTVNVKQNKMVVAFHYQETGDHLYRTLKEAGLNPAIVYGGQYKTTVEKAMAAFDNDPTCRVMLVQPASGGAGLDMQRASHLMALYEPPSTPGALDQLIARICRGGQTEPVSIFYPQVLGTAMIARFENCIDKKQRSDEITLTTADFLKEMFGDGSADDAPEADFDVAAWAENFGM